IVDQGKVIAMDTPNNLIHQLTKEREIRLHFADGEAFAVQLKNIAEQQPDVTKIIQDGEQLTIWSTHPEATLYVLFKHTSENSIKVEQISIKEMSLEDVFIAFTGKEWTD